MINPLFISDLRVETAAKLGVNAMDYIADRITHKHEMPHLATLVRIAYA